MIVTYVVHSRQETTVSNVCIAALLIDVLYALFLSTILFVGKLKCTCVCTQDVFCQNHYILFIF